MTKDQSVSAYPLSWPLGWERTHEPEYGTLRDDIVKNYDELVTEVRRMEGTNIIVSSNAERGANGKPSARQRTISDTGVAVYFELDGVQKCFPNDRFVSLAQNMRAIAMTIEALRGIARWGTGQMVTATFQGFDALPETTGTAGRHWSDVLGVPMTADLITISAAYKLLAQKYHPDTGFNDGDPEKFKELTQAHAQAKEFIRDERRAN